MIYAKTGMAEMPEKCEECPKHLDVDSADMIYCDLHNRRYTGTKGKPDWCPLTEIDETLPAQLAAAETTDKETEDTNAR